jgi:two-component SAPR family response regulator
MNIIAVDDEAAALRSITRAIRSACPGDVLATFTDPEAVLDYAQKTHIDIAFLDIDMREMSGLELAFALKRTHSETNIIFVTAYSDFTGKALKMHASGYIMKPASVEDVRDEIANLRNPPLPSERRGVYVRCFGSFEIFKDSKIVFFHRSKAKEILAYLIDRRGAAVSNNEMLKVIWNDREDSPSLRSQLRTLYAVLQNSLFDYGLGNWIVKRWNTIAVQADIIPCDYYDCLNGKVSALNAYNGEYMSQYPWALLTKTWLEERKKDSV